MDTEALHAKQLRTMGTYLSLSRIIRDDSYITDTNENYIVVDFDLKENFFVEFIDTLKPMSNGIYNILRDVEIQKQMGLNESNFFFFTRAGSFEDGVNVEVLFEPGQILKTFNILLENRQALVSSKVFEASDWASVHTCTDFLKKAVSDNNFVQFFWQ